MTSAERDSHLGPQRVFHGAAGAGRAGRATPRPEIDGPKGGDPRRALGARPGRASARPVQAADAAQARLFEDLLQREVAELSELIAAAQVRRGGPLDRQRRAELRGLRSRLIEVHHLLDALRTRFPPDRSAPGPATQPPGSPGGLR